MTIALGCASGISAVSLLGDRRVVAAREAGSGMSPVAYGAGALIADAVIVLWNALVFCGVWTAFGHAGSPANWAATIIGTAFAASGVGYIASALTRPVNAIVTTIMMIVVFSVFSGIEPPLASIITLPVVNWLWVLSLGTWTAEATYVTYTEFAQSLYDIPRGAAYYGFESKDLRRAIGALIALGLAWRIVAIVCLYATLKRQQPAWLAAALRGLGCRR